MKKKILLTFTLIAFSVLSFSACSPLTTVSAQATPAETIVESAQIPAAPIAMPSNNWNNGNQNRGGNSNSTQQQDCCDGAQNLLPTGELTQAEIDSLTFMREEEKLARDVYLTLYDQWGLPIFQNIASSEQKHTDSVKGLLDLYGITDPVANDSIGVFTDDNLQALYDQLVAQGSASLVDAFKVGAAIEEIDILDLQEGLSETDDPNIIMVYNNLLNGSYNHLRSFVSQIKRQTGESYQPQYMPLDSYNTIISASSDRRNGGQGGGRRGGRGKS